MATKSANVLARVEPEVKEQAESIMSKLGLPASVVTPLWKQDCYRLNLINHALLLMYLRIYDGSYNNG